MSNNTNIKKSESWRMFNEISLKYDMLNRLLSFGLDIRWRLRLGQYLLKHPKANILDLATGTADVLISLFKRFPQLESGYGIDMAEKMLEIGWKKIQKERLHKKITLKVGDANHIPFNENIFDNCTMAFGIRNVEDPLTVLKQIQRVLKPKGRALILEFSMPQNSFIRFCHLFYLRTIVPLVGWLVSGHYRAYRYLNQTIEQFPYGDGFCQLMLQAGFSQVKANPLLFGVATIYQGDKL